MYVGCRSLFVVFVVLVFVGCMVSVACCSGCIVYCSVFATCCVLSVLGCRLVDVCCGLLFVACYV